MKKYFYLMAGAFVVLISFNTYAQTVVKSVPISKEKSLKNVVENKIVNKEINPLFNHENTIPATRSSEEYVLKEDFQEWDGNDPSWLPQDWEIKTIGSLSGHPGWHIYEPRSVYEEITSKCMVFESFENPVNQWLITPKLEISEGMELSFYTFPSPLYYFDWNFIDWTTYTFTEMNVINDFKVCLSEDDGETWVLLKSLANEFKDITGYSDLFYQAYPRTFHIDLSNYVGKNVRIGFQVEGENGNIAMIDNVYIGFPSLEVAYSRPYGALFFGLSSADEYVPASIMAVPVYKPVTFYNESPDTNAIYTWTYNDSDGPQSSDNQKELTVTYHTDYTNESTTRNNLYEMPVLTASAERYATTEFSYPYFLQAGGKGEYEKFYPQTNEKEIIDLGLGIVDPMTEGTATWTDIALPYFGYNQESDRYWTDKMLNGDPDLSMDEDNYSHLIMNGNLFYATEAPLVINGVRANGYGRVDRNAVFKAEIYLIGRNWMIPETPYATAICTGDDITIIDRYASNYILSFNFKFDEPIVMSTELTPYYFVAVSGFHDPDHVEYYSPEMSEYDNPDGLALGWIGKKSKLMGNEYPVSWSPVYEYTGSYVSFYIMLDAVYPWLESQTESVEIGNGETVSLALDSYYDGSSLSVENLPSWLQAKPEGRYGEAFISFTSSSSEIVSAEVTVIGPGVAKTIIVNNTGEGKIENISVSDLEDYEEIYTLTGIKVSGNINPGIYIIKNKKGDITKRFIKK